MNEKAERKKFFGSLALPALLVTLMWAIKVIETAYGVNLSKWGLLPHSTRGLLGVFTMPFLHSDWEHLMTNTVPLLVLGTALYYCYPTLANGVMLLCYLGSGLLTWCIGRSVFTVGSSALIYGLNFFLIFSGFIRGNRQLIVISLIVVFLYGSFVWGTVPSLTEFRNISWEGHLSGAIVGTLLAITLRKKGPQKEVHHWEEDDDDDNDPDEKPYWDVPMPSNDDLNVKYHFRH